MKKKEVAGFTVERSEDGLKNGWTRFYDEVTGKETAAYLYINNHCDYLQSYGFEEGSMAYQRQAQCIKANKKRKAKSEEQKARFFSLDKGFFSLAEMDK